MPNIAVVDHDGNILAESQSVTSAGGVCRILWTAPNGGSFHLKASDLRHGSRGGSDFLYRLSVVPAEPDFVLKLASDNIGVVQGSDALLVMPTGAGKSLCYQLPALARGGTALVISPLIALMEDQVAQLRNLGFQAARIHSGRDRAESRDVCARYLEGRLDFLFVAPERLGVPGFCEFLARRAPALIAVDEAHCISQWGHDFRPDYRKLGPRLECLREAPLIAMTATATPLVQRDILQQLDLPQASTFIHGFRRDNIAIELVELNPGARSAAILKLLTEASMRPAIVYAPTRRGAEPARTPFAFHTTSPSARTRASTTPPAFTSSASSSTPKSDSKRAYPPASGSWMRESECTANPWR